MKEEVFLEVSKLLKSIKQEKPQKADAIVWLQGDRYDRGRKVLNLFRGGWAPKIVVSGNDLLIGPDKIPGENNVSLTEMVKWLKKRGIKSRQIIIDGQSFNTLDQAKNIFMLIKEKRWKKIILVASLYHQPRAFLTFLKESRRTGWTGRIVNQPAMLNLQKKPSGRNKTASDLIFDEIGKIKKYRIYNFKKSFQLP
jgi:uncharacterized SAM-binding protein YcdF (DUF218 family)